MVRTVARARLPPPLRQGELDSLCGVYAIINAVRLTLASERAFLARADMLRLFGKLVRDADRRVGKASVTTRGIDTAPLWKLVGTARKHLAERHSVVLVAERPFHRQEAVSATVILQWLAISLDKPTSAVVLGIGGEFDHWTVAHRLTPHYLAFYDSSGIKRILLERCRREAILDGASIIWLRLAPGSA